MNQKETNGCDSGAWDPSLEEPQDEAYISQESGSDREPKSDIEDDWVCLVFDGL